MSSRTTLHDLKSLVCSYHSLVVIETVEEERVSSMLVSIARELRLPLFEWSVTRGLSRFPEKTAIHGTSEPLGLLRHLESVDIEALFHLKDFGPHLGSAALARSMREVVQKYAQRRATLFITGDSVELPKEIDHAAVHITLEMPDQKELLGVVRTVIKSLQKHHQITVDMKEEDMSSLLRAMAGLTLNQARQAMAQSILADSKLGPDDIQRVLKRKGEMIDEGEILEYYPQEDNHFEIGGFGKLKAWLDRSFVGFSQEARALNLRAPRGVLFVGVQGCGKSLAAKFIARQWKLPLLKLDAGRLYDKYVGESERNFRRAVTLAEAMAPVVLWIDEIEKVFAQGGSGEADGGLSRRLFGAFLTWLQEKKEDVFVVGAANNLMSVPPELLRKGRFDEIFFVDLPEAAEREAIFEIHLRLRKQAPGAFNLKQLTAATSGFSGAEIEQVIVASLYRSLHRKEPLETQTILEEIAATVPLSVSRSEDIEHIRELGKNRFASVR